MFAEQENLTNKETLTREEQNKIGELFLCANDLHTQEQDTNKEKIIRPTCKKQYLDETNMNRRRGRDIKCKTQWKREQPTILTCPIENANKN